MTAPAVDTDWLRSNPADAFSHSVPKDFAHLLDAGASYRMLFEDWLAVHHQDVLPGFTQPEIDVIYRRLADPVHPRSEQDKAWAKYFADGYKKAFLPTVTAIRADMRAKMAPIIKNGGDKATALRTVGQQAAAQSVGKALSAAATDVPATLAAWAQVQAYKGELVATFNTALVGFGDEHWAGREQERAKAMLVAAWDSLQRAESAMRETVLAIGPAGDADQALRAQLDLRLTMWATEVANVAAVTARAANEVSVWAQRNASRIISGDFNAMFPVIGGLFEATHLLVGAFGVVAGFFPQLAPISAGISIADDLVDLAGKRVIVAFASRNKDTQVKLAGAKFELSEKFKQSRAGKFYLGKEKVKGQVQKQVDKVLAVPGEIGAAIEERAKRNPLVQQAYAKKQAVQVAVHDRLMRLRDRLIAAHPPLAASPTFNNAIDKLDTELGTLEPEDGEDDDAANRLEEAITGLFETLNVNVELPTSLTDLALDGFVSVCEHLAPTTIKAIRNVLGRALPFVNIAVFAVSFGNSALNYWADVNKVLVPDNMTEEEQAQLQAFVAQQVHGTNPLFHGIDFSRVTIISVDPAKVVCEIAGVRGELTRDTLRFSPDDRSAMHQAVLAQVKKNNSPSFTYQYTQLTAAWDELTWGEEEHGVIAATVTATAVGKQDKHTLTLSVLPDGAITVMAADPELPPPDLTKVQAEAGPPDFAAALAAGPGGTGLALDLINGFVEATA